MKMADAGWVWEGQGLDPGVHPSIFGVGEGAEFFGLRRVHFIFHPATDLALRKLSKFDEVVCDISKWRFRDCGTHGGGSECYPDSSIESIRAEAEAISRFSLTYPNVTGGFFDDMRGLMEKHGHGPETCQAIRKALRTHNPALELECVVYSHEIDPPDFWEPLRPFIDMVSFWVWGYERLGQLEEHLGRCRACFPGKPIRMGCYLRDYPTQAPMPMHAVSHQWNVVRDALGDGRIASYDILGAVLIDGQLEQATWIRDFIASHS